MKRIAQVMAILSLAVAGSAEAYPEFVRHGYFSCTSCHVSPGGGSTLTDYGRSFAAEKLVTWTAKDEERPGHGILPALPESLVLGGNFRQIQTVVESSRSRTGRWIPMQRDVDACAHLAATWTCGTVGMLPKEEQGDEASYGLRKAQIRVDLGENFVVRAGRFHARHGLMIANHTSPVRRGLGFDQGKEADVAELTFLSEFLEVSAYREFGRKVRFAKETAEGNSAFADASGLSAATLIKETSRVGLSYRRVGGDDVAHVGGMFAAIGWSPQTFTLFEVDQKAVVKRDPEPGQSHIARGAVSHVKLAHEPTQGVVPYLLHEADVPDLRRQETRKDLHGLGAQWFPRPHLELDLFYGHLLVRQDYSYAAVAYLLLHYYL